LDGVRVVARWGSQPLHGLWTRRPQQRPLHGNRHRRVPPPPPQRHHRTPGCARNRNARSIGRTAS